MKSIYSEVLDRIVFLYAGYSKEYRGNTQPFQLDNIRRSFPAYRYRPADTVVRETLIEHTGSLPVVATAVYPHINAPGVDLGKALTMLALHDIGELVVGDKIAFSKSKDTSGEEREALRLLPEQFHSLYLDMENRLTDTGKFAKAIDQMTPDIVDMLTPAEITVGRYKTMLGKEPHEIVPMVRDYKHPFMVWNDFLKNLHLEILGRTEEQLKPFYR